MAFDHYGFLRLFKRVDYRIERLTLSLDEEIAQDVGAPPERAAFLRRI
jgi:hypothetical protein